MPALGWWQSVKVVQLNIITCCSVSDRLSMCQLRGKYGIYQLIHPRIKYRHHVNWQVTSLLDRGIVNIPVSQEALSSIKEQRCFHQLRPWSAMNKIRTVNLPRIFYATKNRLKCLTLSHDYFSCFALVRSRAAPTSAPHLFQYIPFIFHIGTTLVTDESRFLEITKNRSQVSYFYLTWIVYWYHKLDYMLLYIKAFVLWLHLLIQLATNIVQCRDICSQFVLYHVLLWLNTGWFYPYTSLRVTPLAAGQS